MGYLKVLTVLACAISFMLLYTLSSEGLQHQWFQQAGKILKPIFEADVVNVRVAFPEKLVKHLNLGSRSWQDYYHTNCCRDIYIDVRTSSHTQRSRLPLTVMTWMQTLPPNQVG